MSIRPLIGNDVACRMGLDPSMFSNLGLLVIFTVCNWMYFMFQYNRFTAAIVAFLCCLSEFFLIGLLSYFPPVCVV